MNHEQTLINGKLFVNENLVAEKILAINNTMHFISQDQIFIESKNSVNGGSGSIHIGMCATFYINFLIKTLIILYYIFVRLWSRYIELSIVLDKDGTSIQAEAISFKGFDGTKYLYVSRESMEANIRLLNLKGKNWFFMWFIV